MKLFGFIYWHNNWPEGLFWIRIFSGHGFCIEDRRLIPADFGERKGFDKSMIRLGSYRIKYLPPPSYVLIDEYHEFDDDLILKRLKEPRPNCKK